MNCTFCSDVINQGAQSWVTGSDGKAYHTGCLFEAKRLEREHEAAEMGIVGGQGRSAGDVAQAGKCAIAVLLIGLSMLLFGIWLGSYLG